MKDRPKYLRWKDLSKRQKKQVLDRVSLSREEAQRRGMEYGIRDGDFTGAYTDPYVLGDFFPPVRIS